MGQSACKGCLVSHPDIRHEFESNSGRFKYEQEAKQPAGKDVSPRLKQFPGEKTPPSAVETTPTTTRSQSPIVSKRYLRHNAEIVRLQAFWRGYAKRKAILSITRSAAPNHSYFSMQEIRATLRRAPPPEDREKRPVFEYKSGAKYTGQWRGGFRDGYGMMEWPDGSSFDGNWAYSRPYGLGKFVLYDGEEFEGSWRLSKFASRSLYQQGVLRGFEHLVQDGYVWLLFKHEVSKRSQAKITVKRPEPLPPPNKLQVIYERQRVIEETLEKIKPNYMKGAFTPSKKTLAGERTFKHFKFPDQSVYTGEWLESQRDGRGKLIHMNGDTYEGEWVFDRQCGLGKQLWADGSVYTGGFKDDQKDGVGEYVWADRSRYCGEWKANKIHGQGRYLWSDGRIYVGEWGEGQMEGFGELVYQDGKKYIGYWCKGKKHGEGMTVLSDGTKLMGVWERGKLRKD